MKRLLRFLFRAHLYRPGLLWACIGALTLLLGLGVFRVEKRLDLMSLLPLDHPVVRASVEAGVGQQEILWLAAEGKASDLETREAWAESLVGRLLEEENGHIPLNGMGGEGRMAPPTPVPGPKGVSLWPALLAAGSFLDGDPEVGRLVTEQFYGMAPLLLGDRLNALTKPEEIRRRFKETAKGLGSPEPVQARFSTLDPLHLRSYIPQDDPTFNRVRKSAKGFPLRLRTGYLETLDGRYVLVPLVLDFPSSDALATAKVMVWLGRGAVGPLPRRASLKDVESALQVRHDSQRPFPLQVTGAHAVAYWEAQRLGGEIIFGLLLSFVLIGAVYWVGFRTLTGYGFVLAPLLLGMFWALGATGWILGRLNLMAAAFGAVLLGIGDDVGIMVFSRYRDERRAGQNKRAALHAALFGTGPAVIAATSATSMAFLSCIATPFPGFRDLGFTAGFGLLACLVSTFLLLPAMLLAFDRGRGAFALEAEPDKKPIIAIQLPKKWRPIAVLALIGFGAFGIFRLEWEEDLRRFRQAGNPALELQEGLGRVLGAGLQPLAIQMPLDEPETTARRWNRIARILRREGLPLPDWRGMNADLRRQLGSRTWSRQVLEIASEEGLDPVLLERPIEAFRASVEDPMASLRALNQILARPRKIHEESDWGFLRWFKDQNVQIESEKMTLPLRLPEAALDRISPEIEAAGAQMIGNRPLFKAIKTVARDSLQGVLLFAFFAVFIIVTLFGKKIRFVALAAIPVVASQVGVLGLLGWVGEPLTFLSIIAIPIALGVSVDTALNLLHRARQDAGAVSKVARVNAVCAGTTLAGFGGLVFSGYRGLRGLGLACLGGTALALLVTQWLLPWILNLKKRD